MTLNFKQMRKNKKRKEENKMRKTLMLSLTVLLFVLLSCGLAFAISGQCAHCHTMHFSQDGAPPPNAGPSGPYGQLLLDDCLGCHTGTNNPPTDPTPYVLDTVAPTYDPDGTTGNTLAGGNFYWVSLGTNDSFGHNVSGLSADSVLTSPPGYDSGRVDSQGNTPGGGSWSGQVHCAGANGCHGTHAAGQDDYAGIRGAHHANATGSLTTATTVGNSYRFLIGIHGYEDSDYEFQPTASAHNQYKGVARTGADLTDKITISWSCGECHGQFHTKAADVGPGASPWLRHPTDFSLNDATGTEYASYNGAVSPAAAPYSVAAPVGSVDVSSVLSQVDVTQGAGTDNAIVTCISCHRAHGTHFPDSLRWDYDTIIAGGGGGNIGCFICHTTKD
jgi:hypothetical protein